MAAQVIGTLGEQKAQSGRTRDHRHQHRSGPWRNPGRNDAGIRIEVVVAAARYIRWRRKSRPARLRNSSSSKRKLTMRADLGGGLHAKEAPARPDAEPALLHRASADQS